MSFTPSRFGRPTSVIVSPFSYEGPFGSGSRRPLNTAGYASIAWATVNLGLFIPIICETPFTIVKFWVHNGTTANGNVDVGLYSDTFDKLLSSGALAQSGTSVLQSAGALDVADTTFRPGRYYLGISLSSATGTVLAAAATTAVAAQAVGCFQMASAHALPTTATPALFATLLAVPNFGFSQRTLVA